MSDTLTIPKVGKVDKKYVYAGGALVAGIVGYAYWKRRAGGGDEPTGVAIDPATGLPYDPAAYGTESYTNPNPNASGNDDVDSGAIDTNPEWAAAVTEKLGTLGTWDSTFVATTLGKYLTSQPLTSDEAALIRSAWAYMGYPPDGPRTINSGGTDPGTTTPVKPAKPTGLRVQEWSRDGINVNVKWNTVPGATSYRAYLAGGVDSLRFQTETSQDFYVFRVGRGAPWKYGITAVNAAGESEPATLIFDNSKG